jgi:hypothetical protein
MKKNMKKHVVKHIKVFPINLLKNNPAEEVKKHI